MKKIFRTIIKKKERYGIAFHDYAKLYVSNPYKSSKLERKKIKLKNLKVILPCKPSKIICAADNYYSKYSKNKSYMVTSSNPSEGKTTFSFNLALSLEKSSKVLFIEADIRRPSVLNGFYQFDREILGLGEIITGSAQLNEVIFKVPGTELDIITSGEKRFDMSDIVNKEQIKKFLDVLKIEYDYVIVDSPPVQPVSDTLILSQASDYNLFVIRSEETRTASFMSSIKKVHNVGAKINGIVINDLDTSKDSYYSYYYSYSPEYYTKS